MFEIAELFDIGCKEAVPKAIKTDFYVDDFLTSFASDIEAGTFAGNVSALLYKGGLRLIK